MSLLVSVNVSTCWTSHNYCIFESENMLLSRCMNKREREREGGGGEGRGYNAGIKI